MPHTFYRFRPSVLSTSAIPGCGLRWTARQRWELLPRPAVVFGQRNRRAGGASWQGAGEKKVAYYFQVVDRERCLNVAVPGKIKSPLDDLEI